MSFLAFSALFLACILLGRAFDWWWLAPGDRPESRWVLALVAGWVALYAVSMVLSLCGIPWRWWSVGLPVLVLVALARRQRRLRRQETARPAVARSEVLSWQLGWGDAVAALALFAFAFFAARGEILFPDFVYHWGTKAQKFALVGGVDWQYLALPWLRELHHPEYPHLLPVLGALTSLLAGFDARAIGLWSVVALIAIVLALRGALRGAGAAPLTLQAATAWAGAGLSLFGINYLQAGSADPFPALALAVALPALLLPRAALGAAHDVQMGLAAALAASAKIEGVLLAAVLLAVHLGRRTFSARRPKLGHTWSARRPTLGAALRAGLPAAVVVVPWLYGCWRYGLRSNAAGRLDLSRLPVVAEGIWRQLFTTGWFGMAALLVLLPVLLARRDLRALGAVVGLQLSFYAYTYLSAPFEPGYYIVSTFPRLTLHLLPVVVAGAALAMDRWQREAP